MLDGVRRAAAELGGAGGSWEDLRGRVDAAAAHLGGTDRLLRGPGGLRALVEDPALGKALDREASAVGELLARLETALDAGDRPEPADGLEVVNASLVRARDALWALGHDRLRTADAVRALAGPDPRPGAVDAFAAVQTALSAIDRLEVRGRDSAGIHVLVSGHGLDLAGGEVAAQLAARRDPLFHSGAVRAPSGALGFVYKAASEIGELGDNVRKLRAEITADPLLHRAVEADGARVVVLAHTRWASVGMINEANAHPLDQEEAGAPDRPYAVAALNGDIDNHEDLVRAHGLRIPPEITTDAKVIPVLMARRLADGAPPQEAFRRTVAEFEGSVAIVAATADPDRLYLAVRGSGQALYVGLRDGAFLVASEPYGLVEETSRYIRVHGGATGKGADVATGAGQVVVLDRRGAGTLEGVTRVAFDATPLPVGADDVRTAEVTTRDIDRGSFPHYLLKEISEAPGSFRKTMRGRVAPVDGRLRVTLADDVLPQELRRRLRDGAITRILVIGQGTAAVAAASVAATVESALQGRQVGVAALPATELSGFGLRDDMTDTLVVAISQSGTTTDTNRTVDLVRARGASVVAIVNRRNSDLTHKADGVLYSSDGRDVEMSVASTKAYYAQVGAGALLAMSLAAAAGIDDGERGQELLAALRELPEAMERVLARRERIAEVARRFAPAKRHWAVVGGGRNRMAAQEIRIKLSELCYKSIACDATEDKKHIDLSSEPLVLVCAAGLGDAAAADVAKEVAIFRAHKGTPIVIATEGESRFGAASAVIEVPATHPWLAHLLATMAGHLFGYQAALAIDEQAIPLRQARAAVARTVAGSADAAAALERLAPALDQALGDYSQRVLAGLYDGTLEASTAVGLASALRFAHGDVPLDLYPLESGKLATPAVVIEDLTVALTKAIDELTRPVDAIKHQAKTVTVGISRSDDALLAAPLVGRALAAGASRERLGYETLRTLAALDAAVAEVTGFIRYHVEGDPSRDAAHLVVLDRGGIGLAIPSRVERDGRLRGSKELVATERRALATRGRSDGRTVVIIPEVKGNVTTDLTLLHVQFRDRLPAAEMRRVLEGYRGRFARLRSAVTETEPAFDEALLARIPAASLVTDPVDVLADRWRGAAARGGER